MWKEEKIAEFTWCSIGGKSINSVVAHSNRGGSGGHWFMNKIQFHSYFKRLVYRISWRQQRRQATVAMATTNNQIERWTSTCFHAPDDYNVTYCDSQPNTETCSFCTISMCACACALCTTFPHSLCIYGNFVHTTEFVILARNLIPCILNSPVDFLLGFSSGKLTMADRFETKRRPSLI